MRWLIDGCIVRLRGREILLEILRGNWVVRDPSTRQRAKLEGIVGRGSSCMAVPMYRSGLDRVRLILLLVLLELSLNLGRIVLLLLDLLAPIGESIVAV